MASSSSSSSSSSYSSPPSPPLPSMSASGSVQVDLDRDGAPREFLGVTDMGLVDDRGDGNAIDLSYRPDHDLGCTCTGNCLCLFAGFFMMNVGIWLLVFVVPPGVWVVKLVILSLYTGLLRFLISKAEKTGWYINLLYIYFNALFSYIGASLCFYLAYSFGSGDQNFRVFATMMLFLSALPCLGVAIFVYVWECVNAMLFNMVLLVAYIEFLIICIAHPPNEALLTITGSAIGWPAFLLMTGTFFLHTCGVIRPDKTVWLVLSSCILVWVLLPFSLQTSVFHRFHPVLATVQLVVNIVILAIGLLLPSILPVILGGLGIAYYALYMLTYITITTLTFAIVLLLAGAVILLFITLGPKVGDYRRSYYVNTRDIRKRVQGLYAQYLPDSHDNLPIAGAGANAEEDLESEDSYLFSNAFIERQVLIAPAASRPRNYSTIDASGSGSLGGQVDDGL